MTIPVSENMLEWLSDAGYIVISAYRSENTHLENFQQNKKIKADIKASKFAHLLAWSEFIETTPSISTKRKRIFKEQSFLIVNEARGKSIAYDTSEELKEFGQYLIKKYHIGICIYKPKNKSKIAYYLDKDGIITKEITVLNPFKAVDTYFSSLQIPDVNLTLNKAYTYSEGIVYFPKSPSSLAEAYNKYGEIFIY